MKRVAGPDDGFPSIDHVGEPGVDEQHDDTQRAGIEANGQLPACPSPAQGHYQSTIGNQKAVRV